MLICSSFFPNFWKYFIIIVLSMLKVIFFSPLRIHSVNITSIFLQIIDSNFLLFFILFQPMNVSGTIPGDEMSNIYNNSVVRLYTKVFYEFSGNDYKTCSILKLYKKVQGTTIYLLIIKT